MMSIKLISSLFNCTLLVMAASTLAQTSNGTSAPVLDTTGQPLQRGVEYYINPAITDNGGRFTLISRNGSCPLYVGQENLSGPDGLPITFTFCGRRDSGKESRDIKITFSVSTICLQLPAWKLSSERDEETQRRLIEIGQAEDERRPIANYFKIVREGNGLYKLEWCPTQVCPICRFDCTTTSVGVLVENGKRLLALVCSALHIEFEQA